VAKGPLIPGMNEFDRPKKGLPRWVGLFIALSIISFGLLTIWGFVAGGGPFSQLGQLEQQLQPVGFRPTVEPEVIQVQVQLPKVGACPSNTFDISAEESIESVSVAVELISPRDNTCPGNQLTGEIWLDLALTEPLATRLLIRSIDGQELPQIR
jgi:hypothetical protein